MCSQAIKEVICIVAEKSSINIPESWHVKHVKLTYNDRWHKCSFKATLG